MTRVFVYGTLKTDEPNYHVICDNRNGQAELVGKAITVKMFPLLIASRYNVPYLLYKPGFGNRIHGEVYEVDEKMFGFLDKFENCPRYYSRVEIELELLNGGKTTAWMYTLKDFKEDLLQGPFYRDYSSKGDHGLEYNPKDVTDPELCHYDDVKS